jgi:endoglucanase
VEKHNDKVKNEKKASWKYYVDELACFSLASVGSSLSPSLKKRAVNVILRLADNILKEIRTIPYRIPYNKYEWGSNGETANDALTLVYAYNHSGKREYLEGVVETVDYLFGKNAVGYSFLTGFGHKSPQNIHHRPSAADGIDAPVPGFLVGGPNHERQDSIEKNMAYGVKYPFKEPAKFYLDLTRSYASNEVCINWNAPLVFVLGFLELYHQASR